MQLHRTSLMMLAACSLLLPASVSLAQQPSRRIVQTGHGDQAECLSGDWCDGCGAGYGNTGRSGWGSGGKHGRHGYGAGGCRDGHCGYGCGPHCGNCCLGRWLNAHSPYHRCTFPPDHGFAPPAHRPIYPTPALYSRMFAGQAGAGAVADPGYRHPMVYMPTDTTQLGFYYQQVPYWQQRAGMIPPVPQPAEWHTPDTGVVFTGFEDGGFGSSLQGCPAGDVVEHGGGSSVSSPSVPSDSYPSPPVQSSPVPMIDSAPPYSPEPVNPLMVPPAADEAPAPPTSGPSARTAPVGQDLEKSASLPLLIPVPPQ